MEIKRYRLVVERSFQRAFFAEIEAAYFKCDDWVRDWVFALDGDLDAPASVAPGSGSGYMRPPRHRRVTYFSPRMTDAWPDGPVICIKGMEPVCANLDAWLQLLSREGPSNAGFRLIEHFPLVEGKAPLALINAEAFCEAGLALDLHGEFKRAGLQAPRIPFPLAVLRHNDETVEKYCSAVQRHTTKSVLERVRELTQNGLYCYVYLYPGPCARVADVATSITGNSYESRAEQLVRNLSVQDAIVRWVGLLADMLALGYVPASRFDRFAGSCFDINNAVVDGGIADVGSCKKFAYFGSDHDLFEAICISIRVLTSNRANLAFRQWAHFSCRRIYT